jgi:hypothetical protein
MPGFVAIRHGCMLASMADRFRNQSDHVVRLEPVVIMDAVLTVPLCGETIGKAGDFQR